jgi:hypothetical protein
MTDAVAAAAAADTQAATAAAATQGAAAPAAAAPAAAAPAAQPAAQGSANPSAQQVKSIGIDRGAGVSEQSGIAYYQSTGNAALDAALKFVVDAGLDDDHPAIKAAEKNDFTLLEAYFAQNPVAGWETMLRIGKEAVGNVLKQHADKAAAVEAANKEAGVAIFGSEENLNAALDYVGTNAGASPDEVAALQSALSGGGIMAQAALLFIADVYNSAQGVTRPPIHNVTAPTAHPVTPGAGPAINRMQFAAECKKLHAQFGDSFTQTPQYAALAARVKR